MASFLLRLLGGHYATSRSELFYLIYAICSEFPAFPESVNIS